MEADNDLAGVVEDLVHATYQVAKAITPPDTVAGHDETGGTVDSLTEAVMGVTAGLCRIAAALDGLADAVRESRA
jgi:hypothetical protein